MSTMLLFPLLQSETVLTWSGWRIRDANLLIMEAQCNQNIRLINASQPAKKYSKAGMETSGLKRCLFQLRLNRWCWGRRCFFIFLWLSVFVFSRRYKSILTSDIIKFNAFTLLSLQNSYILKNNFQTSIVFAGCRYHLCYILLLL